MIRWWLSLPQLAMGHCSGSDWAGFPHSPWIQAPSVPWHGGCRFWGTRLSQVGATDCWEGDTDFYTCSKVFVFLPCTGPGKWSHLWSAVMCIHRPPPLQSFYFITLLLMILGHVAFWQQPISIVVLQYSRILWPLVCGIFASIPPWVRWWPHVSSMSGQISKVASGLQSGCAPDAL